MNRNVVEIKNNLKLQYTFEDPILIVEITGEIDTYNASEFLREIVRQIGKGNHRILLDGENLSYISSTGIGVIADMHKRIAGVHGQIILSRLQPKVNDIFKLLGFAKVFTFVSQNEEAKEILRRDLPKH